MPRALLPIVVVSLLAALACGGLGAEPPSGTAPPPSSATPSSGGGAGVPSAGSAVGSDPGGVALAVASAPGTAHDHVLLPIFAGTSDDYKNDNPYPAWQAFDDDVRTTWVATENESLHIALQKGAMPGALELVPGFAVDQRRWDKNRHPARVRVRYHYAEEGESPWEEHEVTVPVTLEKDPWVRIELKPPTAPVKSVELRVVASTERPPDGDDDICISELRIRGDLRASPTNRGPHRFASHDAADEGYLEAPFSKADLEKCTFEHEYTGGFEVPTWEVTCEPVPEGVRIRGEIVTPCTVRGDGPVPPMCGGGEPPTPVDRVVKIAHVNACFAIIDGFPYTREGC